jgi:zinc protease
VVVAVGELEPEAMLDGLAPFEDWPATAPARAVDTPLVGAPGRGEETRRKAQSAVAMAFPSGPYGSPHRFPLIVSSALLSGLAGRLFQVLRDERSLAYTVAALPWLQRRAGVMLTYIATSPEREAEARQGMLDELSRLSVDAIDDVELDRARNYAAGAVQLRLQSAHAVATDILDAWTFDELDALVEEADRLRAVTREDVRAVAADVFRPEHRAEFVVHGTGGSR